MNLLSLLLGHYNDNQEFKLYRAENTPILLFKYADLCFLFGLAPDLPDTSPDATVYLDKETSDVYLTTTDLATLAVKHNKFLLAELCKLKFNDYATHLDESILTKLPRLTYHHSKKDESQLRPTHIQVYNTKTKVKSEPISPRPPMISHHSDPMALNNIISGSESQQQPQDHSLTRRPSRTLEEYPQSNKRQKKGHELSPILPKPLHTVSSQKMPSLLAKRLGANNSSSGNHTKNTRNLTIYAPSYGEQFYNSIKSAPLNQSHFRQQYQNRANQLRSQHQPHPLSQATLISPATSTATNTPTTANTTNMNGHPPTEFAIPPIVPSQHQPPHTAHPGSIHHPHHHFPPHSPQYPSSAYIHGHGFPHHYHPHHPPPTAPLPPPSSTNSSNTPTSTNKLQKQQFMQPFEHLFDTIETTRTLKSTLDDQIRRSSTLIQTLQASSTTIESLIKNQIKEAQKEVVLRMESSVDELLRRFSALEKRMKDSMDIDQDEGIEEDKAIVNTNAAAKESVASAPPSSSSPNQQQIRKGDLVSPPTIVKSQNDIGPNEYRQMLDILRDRLDKLERQLGS